MFPLVDTDGLAKPVLQIIGEEALAAGIEEICIVTQPGDDAHYRRYFRGLGPSPPDCFKEKDWAVQASDALDDFGNRLTYVAQASPEGYGHAVYQAKDFVGDEPFLLLLGDHIYISGRPANCATQLIEKFHDADGLGITAMTAMQVTPGALVHQFGTLRATALDRARGLFRIDAIEEKPSEERASAVLRSPDLPAGFYFCHFGMHVFSPAIFDAIGHLIRHDIRSRGEIQLTTAQEMMRLTLPADTYGACTVDGQRFDTGIPYGLMEAQLALALAGRHRSEIVAAIARMLPQGLQAELALPFLPARERRQAGARARRRGQ
jgi:UTP--glucose-1-phosphate uridylyltransferase